MVGIDKTASADHVVIEQMINGHFRGIRENERYSKCFIRVFIESNMSFIDSGRIANMLSHPGYAPLECVSQMPDGRIGIITTQATKEGYACEIRRSIDGMVVAEQFVSENKDANVQALVDQLRNFRREIIVPTNNSAVLHYKVALTGKSPGKKDDLVMALGIALYYMMQSLCSNSFIDFCRARGLVMN